MAPITGRRSRALESDDDDDLDESREGTPASTALNDSKRARRGPANDEETTQTLARGPRPSNGILTTRRVAADGATRNPKHKPGAIVRVKLINFVTYTSAEFYPGPNLNMVIGPNGTGKSTLVCAICLGLGWGTQHLGRAKDISEFVKNGCREATIEVELQTGPGHSRDNPIITRLIKREGNKSTFMINGRPANNKLVLELAKSYSIQIDNLCQFLPQDRVVEFSQMSPVDLLYNTQRAVADPQMLEWQESLSRMRKAQKELMSGNKNDREQLKNLENRQEGQRLEVENTRRRADIKQKLYWLEKCRPIPKYADAKKLAQESKQRHLQIKKDLDTLEKEVAPTLRRVNEKEQYEKQVRTLKAQREKAVSDSEKKCDNQEKQILKCDDKIKDIENMFTNERGSVAKKKQERQRHQQEVNRLQRQIDEQPEPFDAPAINRRIQDLILQKRTLEDRQNENRQRAADLKDQGNNRKAKFTDLKTRLDGLDTQAGQQTSKLERKSSDTAQAWRWIQENQDKFEKEVFGPPMVTCSLKDPKMADAMETLFQENDFKIFTVQCQRDFDTLRRTLMRDLKLHDISIRVCTHSSLENFRPALSQDQLQSLGLDGWALDHILGPLPVLAMLCSEKFLHQTGVGLKEITDPQYDAIERTGMRSFIAGRTSYRIVRRAEYGSAGTSTNAREIKPASVWTDQPVDTTIKMNMERQMNEVREEMKELQKVLLQLKEASIPISAEIDSIKKEIDTVTVDKEARQRALAIWKGLPAKLTVAEEKIQAIDRDLESIKKRLVENTRQQDAALLAKSEATITFSEVVSELRHHNSRLLEAEVMHIEALSDFENLKARNEAVHNLLKVKREEEKVALDLRNKAHTEARQMVTFVKGLQEEGQELASEGDTTLADLMTELSAKTGLSTEELEAEIEGMKANLELVQGGDANVIGQYERREEQIQKLRDRLDGSRQKADDLRSNIADLRDKWEPELDGLVSKINDAFGENFARIGCAGSVAVFKAGSVDESEDGPGEQESGDGNGSDFANWALHLSVKFRESEPLSLLDSHRQSGGERAVSTIFYLMSLQSLSRAPFRVVDEINQGMDPRNERMVHGRMVDIAAGADQGDGGSQYFLITPKLLNGLKYSRGMTVLCIVSGENMPSASDSNLPKVDFREFVQRARELGLGKHGSESQGSGRRVDSGVQMRSSFGNNDLNEPGDRGEMDQSRSESRLTSVGA